MTNFTRRALALSLFLAFVVFMVFPVRAQTQTKAPSEKVNINTASLQELQNLPRIGPKIAQRILDYRKQNGSFKKIEELMKVKGIGEKVFNRLKELIVVGPEPQAK
jgi:comEA protein